jgi:hypothetical protein
MFTKLALTLGLLAGLALTVSPSSARAASCVPGFDDAVFGKRNVTLGGGATTDSYSSTAPSTYGSSHVLSGGNIGSNGCTAPTAISLNGAPTRVNGNAAIGAGCAIGSGISTGAATITGAQSAQATNLVLTSVTVPTVGTAQGNRTLAPHSTLNLAANQTYGSITANAGSNLVLSAGTYVVDSITLNGNATLTIGSGPVLIYLRTGMDLSGGGVTNATLKATDMVFLAASSVMTIKITGGTESAFAVYAPDSDVTIAGNSAIFGSIVGKSVTATGGATVHYDRALGTFTGGFTCGLTITEVSRSSPVIANAATTLSEYQGSYELITPTQVVPTLAPTATLAQAQAWKFPFTKGHVRAVPVGSISSTATVFSSLASPVFDAATLIPPATNAFTGTGCSRFSSNCRTVFTNVVGGLRPARTIIEDSTKTAVGPLLGLTNASAQVEVLRRVVGLTSTGTSAPTLGGVDRSTVAVIGASAFAGTARPTIAYVGGADGMLHAICATVRDACTAVGVELWAFLPRTELPYLRSNTAIVNGSPTVDDVYGDFDGTGASAWRTILTFQTGAGDAATAGATPAVYALDVTDPADPRIVWEYTTPATRTGYELGVGLSTSMGGVKIAGVATHVTLAQTNNGGTAGAGTNLYAIDTATGAVRWHWDYRYPANRSGGTGVPATGIPGGVAAIDANDAGYVTDIAVATLYGNLFRLDATTGRSRYGDDPTANPCVAPACQALYQFSTDYHPIGAQPSVFSDGARCFVAIVSGGYADNSSASGSGTTLVWSPSTTNQYLIAVSLTTPATSVPLTSTSIGANIVLATNLGAGNRASSAATISGDEIFVTTDSQNINDTAAYGTGAASGTVVRIALVGGATRSSTTVAGGAGSVDAVAGTAYIASGRSTRSLAADAASGTTAEVQTPVRVERRMWLSAGAP